MASLTTKTLMGAAVAVLSVSTLAIPASAGDLFGRHEAGSIKDAPEEAPKRRCEFSINVAGTTDYVFRGISQNGEDPAAQGGADMSCGIFYAGVWGSTVDFAPYEVDLYGGIKKDLGFAEVDLGVIYYAYPGADDLPDEELNYWEFKLGLSRTWNKFTMGGALYYSPDYTLETGTAVTYEGSLGYEFAARGPITPSISGAIGTTQFYDDEGDGLDYTYWNAGLSLAIDKITLDFRYWDSTGDDDNFCGDKGLCDSRFVFTAKVALP